MKLKVIEFVQNGVKLYTGVAKVGNILPKLAYSIWDSKENPDGYQRNVTRSRALDFGSYVTTGNGISPDSIVINIRDKIHYKEGFLNIPDGAKLWVVDGQHRLRGMQELVKDGVKKILDFEIPIILINFAEDYQEAKQFLVKNKTQKGIKPDLAERLIYRVSEKEGLRSLMIGLPAAVTRGADWRPNAVKIVDKIRKMTDSPWFNNIILPNESRKGKLISQKSFTDSLEPILKDPVFEFTHTDTITKAISNYWNAMKDKDIWSEAFKRPERYVVQKLAGTFAMHRLFLNIAGRCIGKNGKRTLTVEKFKDALKMLVKGGIKDEYWHTTDGPAGKVGTSKKGISIIINELNDALIGARDDKNVKIDIEV